MTHQLYRLPASVLFTGGVLAPGWKVYFYLTGTTTPTPVYTTSALSVAHTQPVVADSAGVMRLIYLDPSITYKSVVYDEDDVLQSDFGADPVNDSVLSQSVIGSLLYPRTAAEIAAGVTPTNYAYPPGDVRRYGASTALTDNTSIFSSAISTGHPVYIPSGTWFGKLIPIAGTVIFGDGRESTIVKIPVGSADTVVTATSKDRISIKEMTISGDGGITGGGCLYMTSCDDLQLSNVKSLSSPGPGIRLDSCDRFIINDIYVDDAARVDTSEWGMQIDNCDYGYAANLIGTNCSNRFVMVRTSEYINFFGITASGNGGTAFWFNDCNYCYADGVTDQDDTAGDTAVIEGESVGCTIRNVIAQNCGGHGASIAADSGGAPVDCHFDGVYSVGQGESMAVISNQGASHYPSHCSIINVRGRNCGRVLASEAFGIANATDCEISGSISDNANDMLYAVREVGANAGRNVFRISAWVAGDTDYYDFDAASLGNSQIIFQRLQQQIVRKGDMAYTWDRATDGDTVIYDLAALTADRDLTLELPWPGREIVVSRPAAGAFNLNVKQGGTTLKALAAATWGRFRFDGANWNLIAYGAL